MSSINLEYKDIQQIFNWQLNIDELSIYTNSDIHLFKYMYLYKLYKCICIHVNI